MMANLLLLNMMKLHIYDDNFLSFLGPQAKFVLTAYLTAVKKRKTIFILSFL